MPEIIPFDLVCMISIDASDVTTSPIVNGCTVADSGVGDFDLTLPDGGIDATECCIVTGIRGATEGVINVIHTSDTVKNVIVKDDGGVAADLDCDIMIFRTKRIS